MMHPEEGNTPSNNSDSYSKKRGHRACDPCKRKKIRCEGGSPPESPCNNCFENDVACTRTEPRKKPSRHPPEGYVQMLEGRVKAMERLILNLPRQGELNGDTRTGSFDKETWMLQKGLDAKSGKVECSSIADALNMSPKTRQGIEESGDFRDEFNAGLLEKLREEPRIDSDFGHFLGRSSHADLIHNTWDRRKEYVGGGTDFSREAQLMTFRARRPEYWELCPWEQPLFLRSSDDWESPGASPTLSFPDDDLLDDFVDLYFTHANIFYPLLHRPSLQQSIAEGLHLRDKRFGVVVMLVCAIGSQYSENPSKIVGNGPQLSDGWKWFGQVKEHVTAVPSLARPCLYDLQMYCLVIMFLQGSIHISAMWALVGVGIRLGQQLGAHRRTTYSQKPTVEEELWKRAFWVLVHLDRSLAYGLGRSVAIQDEDFDLDLPACCDDEYWTHPDPAQAFQQPFGKPSYVEFFICMIKLFRILSVALRTIYSISKSKLLFGFVGPQWEGHVISELNLALDSWIDAIPDHLRWDPDREDLIFFNQSAQLYTTHFHLQILVHRPFVSSHRKSSLPPVSSLSICKDAAHSCIKVLRVFSRRDSDIIPLPHHAMSAFTAAVILLVNIWSKKSSDISVDVESVLLDVFTCIEVLGMNKLRWHFGPPLHDLVCELLLLGRWQLPEPSPRVNSSLQKVMEKAVVTAKNRGLPASSAGHLTIDPRFSFVAPATSLPMNHAAYDSLPLPTSVEDKENQIRTLECAPSSTRNGQRMSMMDDHTVSMWATGMMPNVELDDWNDYFNLLGGVSVNAEGESIDHR